MTAGSTRVLVLAPQGRDAELTVKLLERGGMVGECCATIEALCDGIEAGAGCAIATVEAITGTHDRLSATLAAQPPWSDFPFIITTAPLLGTRALQGLGNVTLLDLPITGQSLLTAVVAALRARGRQYEARAAIEQRDQFLAMLGHELRNPLGVIVLASQLASEAKSLGDVARPIAMITRQAHHLSRLVDDLLDVSRVTQGKIILKRERVDIDDTINSCIASVATVARAQQVTITRTPAPSIILDGDGMRLSQVFDNLLTNAIKYTHVGGAIRVDLDRTADLCVVRICDSGIGISADMLPRIFDLFTQADETLDRTSGGMGIGLTLVKRLVELHDGSVEVTSAGLGTGTEFTIRLPIHEPVMAPVPDTVVTTPRALRVVLVDDNDDIRELSRHVLERLGCVVEVAADGPAGLAQILKVRPDLALVDIGLPGMNGFAVAEQVRAALGDTLVLAAVTGYGQDRDRERALGAGFDVHLTKPVRSAALRELIDRAILHADADERRRGQVRSTRRSPVSTA